MLKNDEQLFDEFKRVDMICGDMFSCRHGISEYIHEMERTASYGRYRVPLWDEDYRNLKHIRWLRNQLVHEMAAVNCDRSDVEWLEDFHRRILSGQDPLAVLGRIGQKPPAASKIPVFDIQAPPNDWDRSDIYGFGGQNQSGKVMHILLGMAALAALLAAFYLVFESFL